MIFILSFIFGFCRSGIFPSYLEFSTRGETTSPLCIRSQLGQQLLWFMRERFQRNFLVRQRQ